MFVPGGSFFVWVGRDEWREGRTDRLPAGRLSVLFFGGVRCGGLPGGGGPSALRWMAAGAEFSCNPPDGGGIGLWWMCCGVFCGVFV